MYTIHTSQFSDTLIRDDELGRKSRPVVLIEKLFISGGEAQDSGQVQPTFDWETVCGSHHHGKGVFCFVFWSFSAIIQPRGYPTAPQIRQGRQIYYRSAEFH